MSEKTVKQQIEEKVKNLIGKFEALEADWEANNTPQEERFEWKTTRSATALAKEAEEALLACDVTSAEGCKLVRKLAVTLDQYQRKTSIRKMVKDFLNDKSEEDIEKACGGNKKAVMALLKKSCDWCKKTYEALKVGQITKTCLMFSLYRWKEENKTRMASVTGELSIDQIKKMAEKDGVEVDKWTESHKVVVYVDITSPTLLKNMFNARTCVGVCYIEKTINLEEVLERVQYELGYSKFLAKEGMGKSILSKEEKLMANQQTIRPKTGRAHKAIAAAAAR